MAQERRQLRPQAVEQEWLRRRRRVDAIRLEYAAGKGFRTQGIKSTSLKIGDGFAGWAAREHRTVQIENLDEVGDKFVRRELLAGENFVSYIAVPLIIKGKVKGMLETFNRTPLKPDLHWLKFLETLAGQTAIAIDNSILYQDVQRSNIELIVAYDATIEGWARALDFRYKETEGHTQRVTEMTLGLARQMGIKEERLIHIRRGAILHDIGKMGVPDHILVNTGKLTPQNLESIRKHPQFAYEMLSPIKYLKDALEIPYCHHERWNGTGYPRGMKGAQIGHAQISQRHANFFINNGGARATAVARLLIQARRRVQEKTGIDLELEIELIGEWPPDLREALA